jgi:hypothetical protein
MDEFSHVEPLSKQLLIGMKAKETASLRLAGSELPGQIAVRRILPEPMSLDPSAAADYT